MALMAFTLCSQAAFSQSGDFTIVLLPDTQNEAQFYPSVFAAQTQWIASNRSAMNIQVVLGLGDIVNDGADNAQQQNADAAIRNLDNAKVPYLLAIGNHDYDQANTGAARRTDTGYEKWFGPARYAGYSYYKGGFPPGTNANFYGTFNISGKGYLMLVLEYVPRDSSLAWAAQVVQANPDKEVIVVTHSYMFYDATRVDKCDTNDLNRDNDGDETWQKFVSQYANISTVVSGHITSVGASRRSDLGVNGNLVNQMFSNYQTLAHGGDGWLRILTFHPASDTIDVKTYSPYLDAFKTDAKNQFTLRWHTPAPGATGGVTGRVDSADCTDLSGIKVTAGSALATTDSAGHYSISGLAPGSYVVTASGLGWTTASHTVNVRAAYPPDVNFYLTSSGSGGGPCPLNPADPSVTICTPANGATVPSPVHIVAGTTDLNTVSLLQIYVDGVAKYTVNAKSLDTSLAMTNGAHRVTV